MKSLNWSESLAIIALVLVLVGLPAAALGYEFALRPALAEVRTIDIIAAAPEEGGFKPDNIRVAAGETVRLRFSVPDVTHGIAIGPGLDVDLGHVDPGEVKEVELTFDRPGRYTFYCNTWCSLNHWRMRGVIQVYDPADPDALTVESEGDPVLSDLLARGVDIDAPHEASVLPLRSPSSERGRVLVGQYGDELPPELSMPAWIRSHSPTDAWSRLVSFGLAEDDAWDVVAYLWSSAFDGAELQRAETLYAKNCAACHGEAGDGRGPGAASSSVEGAVNGGEMDMLSEPTAFADPRTMLGNTSEILYAKLRRGGMGTGMPGFGPVFTPGETWALVGYLWGFVFDD